METTDHIDIGDKVKHSKFGPGTVINKSGEGENAKVLVKFGAEVGEKKLLLKFARLKKQGERPSLAAAESTEGEKTAPAPAPEEKK